MNDDSSVISSSILLDGMRKNHVPGEPGLWVMIFGDMMVFGLFFVTFAVYRQGDLDRFTYSQGQLNQLLGLLNTMLLLTSSLAVASAVNSLREGRFELARKASFGAIFLGAVFVAVKAVEYSEKFAVGITPATNDFFMFYFSFTAIHLLHVLIGIGALFYMRAQCSVERGVGSLGAVEGCAVFWHLVDLLWVVLFAILYLHQ